MAASNNEMISKIRDMTECPVCLEQFKMPRMLPCQHSFCTECLQGLLGTGRKIRCPCCNKETPVPNGVLELPVDFRANSLLEMLPEDRRAKAAREAKAAATAAAEAAAAAETAVATAAVSSAAASSATSATASAAETVTAAAAATALIAAMAAAAAAETAAETATAAATAAATAVTAAETAATAVAAAEAAAAVPAADAAVPQAAFEPMSVDERCPVCEEIPTVSKNLSCGHRLCENCVQFLLPVGGDSLHCPTCSVHSRIVSTSDPGRHSQPQQSQEESDGTVSRLTFHPNCGEHISIHPNKITAHNDSPRHLGNAVVLTCRHLQPDELFEVRLDKVVDGWSDSILIGVTTHTPTGSALPHYISELGPGTWYMADRRVQHKQHNEWTTIKQYEQNLHTLKVGDRVGVQRRVSGALHFYINGVDLGKAASAAPAGVYGVVDLWGNTQQVTITDTSGRRT